VNGTSIVSDRLMESRKRARIGWGHGRKGLTKVSQLRGLGPTGRLDKRETRGCVTHGPVLTQRYGPFTVISFQAMPYRLVTSLQSLLYIDQLVHPSVATLG
jgi:hypothetical protein